MSDDDIERILTYLVLALLAIGIVFMGHTTIPL